MYSQSTLVHANKQDRGAHLGKWQSWRRVKMTMVSQETDWIWAFWAFFSQGKGVKSRLQCWGCMCPAPRAVTKNMGHSHSFFLLHTHTHSHTHFLSLSSPPCFFSLPHYIFNYQVRRETHYFWKSMPIPVFFLTQHKRGADKVHLSRFQSLNTIS